MEGLVFEMLPKRLQEEILEAQSAEAGAKAEDNGLLKEYGELMALYAEIDRRNQEFIEFYCTREESLGDC